MCFFDVTEAFFPSLKCISDDTDKTLSVMKTLHWCDGLILRPMFVPFASQCIADWHARRRVALIHDL